MMKRISYIFILALLTAYPVTAGRYTASFLQIGAGARILGMGSSGVAISNNVSSFYWNPAGLAGIRKWKMQFMYASQFGGFGSSLGNYQYAGFVFPLQQEANIAINWLRFSVDDIPIYPELEGRSILQRLQNPAIRPNGVPQGYFKDNENAYFISFAKNNKLTLDLGWLYFKIPIEIPIGFNFKILQIQLGDESAHGLGFDVGSQLRFDLDDLFLTNTLGKFGFGLYFKDITNTSLVWSTKHRDSIERNWDLGISYDQNLKKFHSKLLLAYSHTSLNNGGNRYGLEWSFMDKVFLRAGVKDKRFAAGAGIVVSFFTINYAFENHTLGYSHRISVNFNLKFWESIKK